MTKNVKRFIPFGVLILLIAIVYLANLHTIFNLSWIRNKHLIILQYVQEHPFVSPLIFIGLYTVSVCLVIPDSTLLTFLSGLVFPLPLAVTYTVVSETLGAVIFYKVFLSLFRLPGLRLSNAIFHKMEKEMDAYPASYMLFLRVSHVVPFWATSIVGSYFRVRLFTFTWTTFLGTLPLAWIIAEAGHSLASEFALSGHLTIADIFTFQIKLALLALSAIVIAPLIYKHLAKRKRS